METKPKTKELEYAQLELALSDHSFWKGHPILTSAHWMPVAEAVKPPGKPVLPDRELPAVELSGPILQQKLELLCKAADWK